MTASSPSFHNQTTKPISLKRRIVALAAPETLSAEPVTGIDSSDTPQPTQVITTYSSSSLFCLKLDKRNQQILVVVLGGEERG